MGTAANLMVAPFGAAIIGGVAGIISTAGFKYLQVMQTSLQFLSAVQQNIVCRVT